MTDALSGGVGGNMLLTMRKLHMKGPGYHEQYCCNTGEQGALQVQGASPKFRRGIVGLSNSSYSFILVALFYILINNTMIAVTGWDVGTWEVDEYEVIVMNPF